MNKYEECFSLAKEQGLFLDDRIERKQINGLWGMYATEKIPKGTKIASFPKTSLLPAPKDTSSDLNDIRWIVSMSREIAKGKDSSYQAHSMMFETMDELQQHSAYFLTREDIETLAQMSPVLAGVVQRFNKRVEYDLERVQEVCPSVDKDTILQTILNARSREWNESGFVPVIDLFNHSEKQGIPLRRDKHDPLVRFVLERDYEPGEQIWITYGFKDMLVHATNYNYFAPSNDHIIDFGMRSVPLLDSPAKEQIAKITAKYYEVDIVADSHGPHKRMIFKDKELYIVENGPNLKLFDYFKRLGFTTHEELNKEKCSLMSATASYLATIQSFLSINYVDDFQISDLSPRLHRFHHALQKEKKMLLANKEWAENGINKLKALANK